MSNKKLMMKFIEENKHLSKESLLSKTYKNFPDVDRKKIRSRINQVLFFNPSVKSI